MCGICGFVGNTENADSILKQMTKMIAHRGPDSEGSYLDSKAAIGFRRLSIIDLSAAGDQPLYNEDHSLVLTFNGEIYNYQELRTTLLEAGHVFQSDTDSETILHGYEEWGAGVLKRMRGMFAFVIWDSKKQELFGARDIFGVKPFYYSQMGETFLYASEIKAMLCHPDFEKKLNEEVLGLYLEFQFVPTEETFFKGVYCLKPGHYFTYSSMGKFQSKAYYEHSFAGNPQKSLEQYAQEIQETVNASVQVHKVADVEVGAYLSGGVDSSYLAYLGQTARTFTVGFEEKYCDETEKARSFASQAGLQNRTKVISTEEYWESLPEVQYYMDEPVADPSAVALYFLSREASREVKVVLSGEGADELFGGYNIYCEPLEYHGFDKLPLRLRRMLSDGAERFLPCGMKGRGFLMRHGKTLEERYHGNATNVFTEKEAGRILRNKKYSSRTIAITKPFYQKVTKENPVTKMQYVDLHLWLVHDILMKGDKMGMAHSLEVRVPYLDREVMELARTLPLDCKIQPPKTKVAFRAAAGKVIPRETATRKKLGFPVPIRRWLREERYYTIVREAFQSETARRYFDSEELLGMLERHKKRKNWNWKADDSRKIWTVYVFLVWYEQFFPSSHI